MKLKWLSVLFAGLASFAAAAEFEGTVTYTMSSRGKDMPMRYQVKGHKVRMETEGGRGHSGVMIMDSDAKTMLILMAEKKMYMEQAMHEGSAKPGAGNHAEVKKTGKTKNILGHQADQYLVQGEGDGSTEVWTAQDLGSFSSPFGGNPMGGKGQDQAWAKKFEALGGFPLLIIHSRGNNVEMRMEATQVEKKSMDAALFKAPAGWTKLDMGAMMGGMGKMRGKREE